MRRSHDVDRAYSIELRLISAIPRREITRNAQFAFLVLTPGDAQCTVFHMANDFYGLTPDAGADQAYDAQRTFSCDCCEDTGVTFAGERCDCAYAYRADANGLVGDESEYGDFDMARVDASDVYEDDARIGSVQ